MEKIDFKDYPDTTTPINADNLNIIQDNAEISINEVDTKNTNLKNQVANGWYEIDPTAVLTFSSWDASAYTGVVSTNIDLTSVLSVGMKVKFTQNSAIKYAFITAITGSTMTLFMGTDYTLTNNTISDVFYSMLKAPYGFPLNPDKWSVIVTDTTNRDIVSAVAMTWYNLGGVSFSIPIGVWEVSYDVTAQIGADGAPSAAKYLNVTLGTTASNDDPTFTSSSAFTGVFLRTNNRKQNIVNVATKQTRYLNTMSSAGVHNLYNLNGSRTLVLRAVCAYL